MADTRRISQMFDFEHEGVCVYYFPLLGVILSGNSQLSVVIRKAQEGDAHALARLGFGPEELSDSELLLRDPPLGAARPPSRFPDHLSLFLTDACTLRCLYCYARGGERPRAMPWEMLRSTVEQYLHDLVQSGTGVARIHFHGGGDVSAAWNLFVQAHNCAAQRARALGLGLHTSVGLNGVLDDVQRTWIADNIDTATVSLDGPPDIHDRNRPFPDGSGSAAVVLDTLRHFDERSFNYGLRATVTQDSVGRLGEIVGFMCERSKARILKVEPLFPHGRASDRAAPQAPSPHIFVEQFRQARRIAKDRGRSLVYSGARLNAVSRAFCGACGESCAVTTEGHVTSCYEIADAHDPLAEMFFFGHFDERTRRIVFDAARLERLRSLTVLDRVDCRECFCRWTCAGDCPAKRLRAESANSPGALDRCYINRELTKDLIVEALEP